jgi:hypothetical protein
LDKLTPLLALLETVIRPPHGGAGCTRQFWHLDRSALCCLSDGLSDGTCCLPNGTRRLSSQARRCLNGNGRRSAHQTCNKRPTQVTTELLLAIRISH